MKEFYIEITQDGIGRLSREKTPNDIIGLYTDKIETCTIILIVSQQGISLIHNTGKIRVADIVNEFRWHKDIVFWTAAYNPAFYLEKNESDDLAERLGYFIENVEQAVGNQKHLKNNDGKIKLFEASNGFVALKTKGSVETIKKPPLIREFEEKKLRHGINTMNNYFLDVGEYCPADIQFTEADFSPLPSLFKTPDEVEALALTPRFRGFALNQDALTAFREYSHGLELQNNPPEINIASILADMRSEWSALLEEDSGVEGPDPAEHVSGDLENYHHN